MGNKFSSLHIKAIFSFKNDQRLLNYKHKIVNGLTDITFSLYLLIMCFIETRLENKMNLPVKIKNSYIGYKRSIIRVADR